MAFVDTDLARGIDAPKTSAYEIVKRALDALESGHDEVLADEHPASEARPHGAAAELFAAEWSRGEHIATSAATRMTFSCCEVRSIISLGGKLTRSLEAAVADRPGDDNACGNASAGTMELNGCLGRGRSIITNSA